MISTEIAIDVAGVIARSGATKQSKIIAEELDRFAPLAMTI